MNYLKIFVSHHKTHVPTEAQPYEHEWEDQTRDVSQARAWLEEGVTVGVVYSVNKHYSEMVDAKEIEQLENGNVRIVDLEGYEIEMPWDDQKRKIIPRYYWIDDQRTFSLKRAKQAVEEGTHNVRVEDRRVKTSSIVRFIDDKTFETSSGSIYEIVV